MADIFVSYASEDRARIEPLVRHLVGAGYSVWWDQALKGGTQFSSEIESAVTNASVVLVAWSPNSVRSRWVADEADLALETGNILPITLDGTRSPMGFRQLQTIDFSGWTGGESACVAALLDAVRHHLSGGKAVPHRPIDLPASAQTKSDASIAVLPFVNMSSDPEQEYFSDGISEELLNLLAKIGEMAVIARTSSFKFKGTDKDIQEIGELLDVAYVLEGSVRKAGNRVRITAQLIETKSNHHLWSETYDRDLDDIFAIQDEISAAIVAELKGLILGGENIEAPHAERSKDVDAYEHYLLGQQLLFKRTNEDITRGKHHFEQALSKDPDYAPALIGLANAIILLSDHYGCYGTMPRPKAHALAQPLLDQALKIDPENAEAYAVQGLVCSIMDDPEQTLRVTKRSLELNKNLAPAYNQLAQAYLAVGDPAAPVFSARRRALELDPTSVVTLQGMMAEYVQRFRFEDAARIVAQVKAAQPAPRFIQFSQGMLAQSEGRFCDALQSYLAPETAFQSALVTYNIQAVATELGHGEQIEDLDPFGAFELYVDTGYFESAQRLAPQIEAMEDVKDNFDTALNLCLLKTHEGDYEKALSYLVPFEDPDPDNWSRLFGLDAMCLGATTAMFLRMKLGKRAGVAMILEKLKQVYQTLSGDPDGVRSGTRHLGCIIAQVEGDKERALSALEEELEKSFANAPTFLNDPFHEGIRDEPRFKALRAKADAHFAEERAKAEAAGLLPIPDEILKLAKTD